MADNKKPWEKEKAPAPVADPKQEATLVGSDKQPAEFVFGEHKASLEDVVYRAFMDTGLTVEGWNDLPSDEREEKIQTVVDAATKLAADSSKNPSAAPVARRSKKTAQRVDVYASYAPHVITGLVSRGLNVPFAKKVASGEMTFIEARAAMTHEQPEA